MTSIAKKRARLIEIEAEMDELRNTLAPIHKKMDRLCAERERIGKHITQEDIPDEITPEWYMKPRNWNNVTSKFYREVDGWIQTTYMSKGIYPDGTGFQVEGGLNQPCIQIMLKRNKPLADQMGLKEFLPFILPTGFEDEERGLPFIKRIGIFEDTLSEFGSWYAQIVDDKFQIMKMTHSREEMKKEFDNVDDFLKYCYEHLYYE